MSPAPGTERNSDAERGGTALAGTETADRSYVGLDTWPPADILGALLDGQKRALAAVDAALPQIAEAARLAADAVAGGGRLVYLASGSPALISLGDALEIPQTYGVPRERIVMIFAGGEAIFSNLTGMEEDDADAARRDVAAAGIGAGDCVISVSASGSTPFTVAGLEAAKAAGAATIAIAGNPNCRLFGPADVAILLETGAEVIAGSTRMGAGTAQKAVLNMFSTLMGVHLGHVHDGLMINVTADNDKLRGRAARIVSTIAGVSGEDALGALAGAQGAVKPAILIAAGAGDLDAANAMLAATDGNLRVALGRIGPHAQD